MENKQFRLKRIRSQIRRLIPVLFLVLTIFMMVLWRVQNPAVVAVRSEAGDFMAPVVSVIGAPARWLKAGKDSVVNAVTLYRRNRVLEAENKSLRAWRALALQLQSEQAEIKRLANYKPYPKSEDLTARLVMDAGNQFSRSYMALAGEKAGVDIGDVALTDKGLFARVIAVGDYGAQLMLLTDYLSRVPVMVGKNRVKAVLAGDNTNHPKLIFMQKPDAIQAGDLVLTSGYMGVYPSGLSVGLVHTVGENEIDVALFEDGEGLEFVRLVDFGLSDVLLKTECKEP